MTAIPQDLRRDLVQELRRFAKRHCRLPTEREVAAMVRDIEARKPTAEERGRARGLRVVR